MTGCQSTVFHNKWSFHTETSGERAHIHSDNISAENYADKEKWYNSHESHISYWYRTENGFRTKKKNVWANMKKKYMNVNEKKKSAINTQHHDQI